MLARMRQARAHHLRTSANKAPLQARRFSSRSTLPACHLGFCEQRLTRVSRAIPTSSLRHAAASQQHKTHVV